MIKTNHSHNKETKNKNKLSKYNEPLTKIGKTMCYLLRHQAQEHGLLIESNGFVKLADLLQSAPMKKLKVTTDQVLEIVRTDEKGRYELVDRPPLFIRAVQGHSIKSVKDEDILNLIENIFQYPVVVHGTYYEAWEKIKLTGLNRMTRNSIHFSIGYKEEDHVISGMRQNCQVYVEINAIQSFYNDLKFYVSKNKVVLSPGNEGVIAPQFFKKVVDNTGKTLYSQKYEIVIIIDIQNYSNDLFSGSYKIIDLKSQQEKKLINSIVDSDYIANGSLESIANFNSLSELFISKEWIKTPFTILIPTNQETIYLKLMNSLKKDINNISFFSEYLVYTESIEVGQVTAEHIKRITLDFITLYNLNQVNQENKEETKLIEQSNEGNVTKINDFRLTKKILIDKTFEKNYFMLFINLECDDIDIITSIDCLLIPKGDFSLFACINYKFESQPIKKNLEMFLEEVKSFLIKNQVFEKLLILCTSPEDYEFLSKLMKRNLIKKPKFFQRNVIYLKTEDFCEDDDLEETAQLFLLKYVSDEKAIEKIQIMY
jgi:2'-phosphotransferase